MPTRAQEFAQSFKTSLKNPNASVALRSDRRYSRQTHCNYFNTNNSTDILDEELLSSKAFRVPVAALNHCSNGKAIAAERVATEMENN